MRNPNDVLLDIINTKNKLLIPSISKIREALLTRSRQIQSCDCTSSYGDKKMRTRDGVVYTPPTLASAVVDCLDHAADRAGVLDNYYYDPCCGQGALLQAATARHPQAMVSGCELDPQSVGICRKKGIWCEQGDLFNASHSRAARWLVNPPYVGCSEIKRLIGADRHKWLKNKYKTPRAGSADLAAYVMRHLLESCRPDISAWIVTKSITEGASRRVALQWAVRHGYQIVACVRDIPWPDPTVSVIVHIIILLDTYKYQPLGEVYNWRLSTQWDMISN